MQKTSHLPKRAVIFANGTQIDLRALAEMLQPDDFLIAADGGLKHLDALGRKPHLLIGDLDSIDRDRVPSLTAEGVLVKKFPAHKDETDLELAVEAALSSGCSEVLIAGGLGGRLDMTLANIFMLQKLWPAADARLEDGMEEVFLIHGEASEKADAAKVPAARARVILGRAGERVSLLALGGPARGIVTEGLEYPLRDETLYPEHARGVSNVMEGRRASVILREGTLICIHTRQVEADKE